MSFDGQFTYITDASRVGEVARAIEIRQVVGLDIETTHLNAFEGEIRLLQVNCGTNEGGKIYVLDLFRIGPGNYQSVLDALAKQTVIKVIQGALFEQKWFLKKLGIELWPIFDTYRASQLIHNGWGHLDHDLWSIEQRELPAKYPYRRVFSEDQGKSDWTKELSDLQLGYAAQDVGWLPELRDVQKEKLVRAGMLGTALIEFGVVLPEAAQANLGFHLNRHKWIQLYEKNLIERDKWLETIVRKLPHPRGMLMLPGMEHIPTWKIDSPQKMAASLRLMGIKVPGPDGKLYPIGETLLDSDGDEITLGTNEMLLAQVAHKYPIIDDVLTYRGFHQRVKTFGPSYLEHINPVTGRLHSNYFPFTGAGRYACSGPQLHNIPRDKEYRACFDAEDGNTLTAADYAGIEMCIVAEVSQDPVLIQVFVDGKDPHRFTASIVSQKPENTISKDERQQAKPVNFGLIYGMMPHKLQAYAKAQYKVTLTDSQARAFHKRYFEAFRGVKRWHELQMRDGPRKGEARTLGGRRRFLAETAYNEFLNTPIQGTGADALKKALREVYFRLKKFGSAVKGIVHHVHDEILVEHEDKEELTHAVQKEVSAGMKEAMETFLKRVPVKVDPTTGKTWADCKG